jgi:hypothetical protein
LFVGSGTEVLHHGGSPGSDTRQRRLRQGFAAGIPKRYGIPNRKVVLIRGALDAKKKEARGESTV